MLKDGIFRFLINLNSLTSSAWLGLVSGRYAVEGEPRETTAGYAPFSNWSKGKAGGRRTFLKSSTVTRFAPTARACMAISPGPSHSAFWTTRMLGRTLVSSHEQVSLDKMIPGKIREALA